MSGRHGSSDETPSEFQGKRPNSARGSETVRTEGNASEGNAMSQLTERESSSLSILNNPYEDVRLAEVAPSIWKQQSARSSYVHALNVTISEAIGTVLRACADTHGGAQARRLWGKKKALSTELGEMGFSKRQVGGFELWCPSPQKFELFFTLSYWVAVFSLKGGILLTFASALDYCDFSDGNFAGIYGTTCLSWANLLVNVFFLAATYLGYVEMINLSDVKHHRFVWPHSWREVRQRVHADSMVAALSYFVAMIFWIVPSIIAVLPGSWSPRGVLAFLMLSVPGLIGGLGFFIAGAAQAWHNEKNLELRNHFGKALLEPVFWVSLFYFIGGANFFLASAYSMAGGTGNFGKMNFLVGAPSYTLGSVFLFAMWRDRNFGVGFLSQLNNAVMHKGKVRMGGRQRHRHGVQVVLDDPEEGPGDGSKPGGPPSKPRLLDIAFLSIYCLIFVLTFLNLLHSAALKDLTNVALQSILITIEVIWMIGHSGFMSPPKEEPYHTAIYMAQFLQFFAGIVQFLIFFNTLEGLRQLSGTA